jgi:hypothetical protein
MMKNEDIVKAARDRMSEAVDGDSENRIDALDDLKFLSGEQWPEEVLAEYEDESRPALTINRLPRFVRQVTGDIRKLNPAVKVLAADNAADPQVAEIMAGLIRQIEAQSDASSVYETAAESAAQCGIGNFRILTEYEHDASFDQVIRIESIPNPLAVYWDPAARKSTRSDAGYCFITDQMDADEFKKAYPDASSEDVEHDGTTDGLENWREAGSVVVAEYFWKEPTEKTIGILSDGTVTDDKEALKFATKKRKVTEFKVWWAKVSGQSVLEGPTEIPSKYIPVVSVTGEEMNIGDRVVRTSVIRHAKAPQQIYNYYASADAETTALQPKAPFLVTADQIAGLESFWDLANQGNKAYLPYIPDPKAPPPARLSPPVMSQAIMAGMQRAEDDMKATTGIFDAGMGAASNEKSGVAIRQRQLESDISTSIYTDNLSKAIEQAGRVMVDMIPRVYDTPRVLRIVGEDDQEQQVPVNQIIMDPMQQAVQQINMLAQGAYDVRVTVGPNYTTQRQETAESMMQFVQAFPQAAGIAGDLIAEAMDWPGADKIAARLKKILPPGIIGIEDLPPEEQQAAQQQMQAQQQQEQEAQQEAQIAKQVQMAMAEAEIRSKNASATEDEADAQKAQAEAAKTQLETALLTGELNGVIAQIVQQQVAAALQQAYQPQ